MDKCNLPRDCFTCPLPDCTRSDMATIDESEFSRCRKPEHRRRTNRPRDVDERTYGVNLHICTASKLLC